MTANDAACHPASVGKTSGISIANSQGIFRKMGERGICPIRSSDPGILFPQFASKYLSGFFPGFASLGWKEKLLDLLQGGRGCDTTGCFYGCVARPSEGSPFPLLKTSTILSKNFPADFPCKYHIKLATFWKWSAEKHAVLLFLRNSSDFSNSLCFGAVVW